MHSLTRARFRTVLAATFAALTLVAVPATAAMGDQGQRGQSHTARSEGKSEKAQKAKAKRANAKTAEARKAEAKKADRNNGDAGKAQAAENRSRGSSNRSQEAQRDSAPRGHAYGKNNGAAEANAAKKSPAQKPTTAASEDAQEKNVSGPAGNKGSMKVRPVGTEAHPPRNYAHLPCTVQVDFYGVPHDSATITAVSHAPTGPTGQTLLTDTVTFDSSSANPRGNELVGSTTLDFTEVVDGLEYHEQQGYHVKLTAEIDGPQGANVKHKVFWIDCAPPATEAESEDEVEGEDSLSENDDEDELDVAAGEGPDTSPVAADAAEGAARDTRAAGDTTAPVDESVLGASGQRAIGTTDVSGGLGAARAALAATGLSTLALALLALGGLGAGTLLVRRRRP